MKDDVVGVVVVDDDAPPTGETRAFDEAISEELENPAARETREAAEIYERHEAERPQRIEALLSRAVAALEGLLVQRSRG
jgi:hypothetical protein